MIDLHILIVYQDYPQEKEMQKNKMAVWGGVGGRREALRPWQRS